MGYAATETNDTYDLSFLSRQIRRFPTLTREEERELVLAHRAGDKKATERLVMSNLRFVLTMAKRYRGYSLPMGDLVQEGIVGLMKSLDRFDPDAGYRLMTYSRWWVGAQLRTYVLLFWSSAKLGTTRSQRKLFFRLRSLRQEVERELRSGGASMDVAATDEQVAAAANVSVRDVEQMNDRLRAGDVSLNATRYDSEACYQDALTDGATIDDTAIAHETKELVHSRLATVLPELDDREKAIIHERLMSDDPKSLRKLGRKIGVSGERVRQIEQNVLRRLTELFADCAAEIQDPGSAVSAMEPTYSEAA
jgi:RNA polymerase sigma-32 factor